jgi:hypothetical protein
LASGLSNMHCDLRTLGQRPPLPPWRKKRHTKAAHRTLRPWKRTLSASDSGPTPRRAKSDFLSVSVRQDWAEHGHRVVVRQDFEEQRPRADGHRHRDLIRSRIRTTQMGLAGSRAGVQLAEVLKPFGDLVAIGQPGESQPTPGAAKLYASHEEWQRVVIGQMKTAKLVVIQAGNTPGVIWEVRKAREILRPCQLLVLMMRMSNKVYDAFLNEAGQALGVSLPERDSLKKRGSIMGFFRFSADWTPDFLPLKAPRLRLLNDKDFKPLFKYALKPVFADNGVKWVEPPIRKMTVFSLIVASLFGLLILAVLVAALLSLL